MAPNIWLSVWSICLLAVSSQSDIIATDILRVFDMTAKYGPCVGISRLDRWKRAQKLGLEPPEEVIFFVTACRYILLMDPIDLHDINNSARARGSIISWECVEWVVVNHIMIVDRCRIRTGARVGFYGRTENFCTWNLVRFWAWGLRGAKTNQM